jgi:DNA-binding transcriptional MerR regulator
LILCQNNEELNALLFPQLERQFFEDTKFIAESSDESIREWFKETEITPTFQDLHDFPNELGGEPKLWYNVKMIELPTEISDQLRLYKGGYMHLPRKYLAHWLWRKFLLTERKQQLPEQLQYLNAKICEYFEERKRNQKRAKVEKQILDIEDLLPPCFEKIIRSDKFPKDTARNAMVRTLAKVNFPLEKIGEYLDELNERDPHDRRVLSSSQNRWDYKAVYEKRYAPVPCGMEICACQGDNLEQKKLNCFGEFKRKFPDRHLKKLWGPIDWFKSEK